MSMSSNHDLPAPDNNQLDPGFILQKMTPNMHIDFVVSLESKAWMILDEDKVTRRKRVALPGLYTEAIPKARLHAAKEKARVPPDITLTDWNDFSVKK
ncbi:hypothetical protein N7532_007635 [Penicillium argentinense]|uniref:Uncharacterized protein n=1 Tax=Penicillium argentinense TaxID=1131581 RepID=A0A9W9K190_9EURO|nr:uncharacterized protein N7532_007635 [Penicillium argentinense]KAJ5088951.1 hypothetical protein N7532_007635 [Penicillium argentinense]